MLQVLDFTRAHYDLFIQREVREVKPAYDFSKIS
jgi:hypothetical protein